MIIAINVHILNLNSYLFLFLENLMPTISFIDYTKIAAIPKGALNLEIEELNPSVNTIALTDKNNHYCINGDQ